MARCTPHILQQIIDARLITAPAPAVFFETGTLEGKTTEMAALMFEQVYTVELSKVLWRRARERFAEWSNRVNVLHGDSAEVLPEVASQIDEPVFFYLDAHHFTQPNMPEGVAGEGQFPLWKELHAITQRPYADIVVVDDVHAFGRADSDWSAVNTESIITALGSRVASTLKLNDQFAVYLNGNEAKKETR